MCLPVLLDSGYAVKATFTTVNISSQCMRLPSEVGSEKNVGTRGKSELFVPV